MTRRLHPMLAVVLVALPSIAQISPSGRIVYLTSADRTKLKGEFFSAANPGPGVLLLHQCNKDRKIWDGLAQQLAASGVNVLTFDLRNFGDSEGKPFDKLTPQEAQASAQKWPADIDSAFDFLVSQPGVKRDAIGRLRAIRLIRKKAASFFTSTLRRRASRSIRRPRAVRRFSGNLSPMPIF